MLSFYINAFLNIYIYWTNFIYKTTNQINNQNHQTELNKYYKNFLY